MTEARALLDWANEEVRTVSFALQPALLDKGRSATAVRVYAESFLASRPAKIAMTRASKPLPQGIAPVLARAVDLQHLLSWIEADHGDPHGDSLPGGRAFTVR